MLSGVGVQVPPSAPSLITSKFGVAVIVDAGWSSLVARRAHNPKVVGSNPAPATILIKVQLNQARNSMYRLMID